MATWVRRLAALRNVAAGVLVAAILCGLLLPVYSDEVGWRLQERAGFDGVDKLYTQLCGPNTLAVPPFWMMPVRYYSALFNGLFAEPIYVRLSGILYALAWLAMLLVLIRRAAAEAWKRTAITTLSLGFLCLGTMPLLLVWSRPEQPVLLAFTGIILIASTDWTRDDAVTPAPTAWFRALAILVLALVAMSYHIKAIFGLPLFLVCLLLASRGRAAYASKAIAGLLIAGAAAWAAHYWIHRFQCPADAAMRGEFERINVGAALTNISDWSQALPLIGKAIGNAGLLQYLGMPAPSVEPMSGWLPAHQIGAAYASGWFLVIVSVWTATLVYAAGCLFVAFSRSWRERRIDRRAAIAVVLLLVMLGWSATQGVRSDYEASFVVPLAVLAAGLALATHDGEARFRREIIAISAGVGLLGIVSVPVVAALYGEPLVAAAGERGYVARQENSIANFGYGALRRDTIAAARKCGIVNPDRSKAVLVDFVTYFTFMRSRLPDHQQAQLSDISTPPHMLAYLKRIGSDGVVMSCTKLPETWRARAKSEGQICCLAPADF